MGLLSNIVEQGFSRVVVLNPHAQDKIRQLKGKVLCLQLTAPEVKLYLVAEREIIKLTLQSDLQPDVILTGSAISFTRFAAEKASANALANYQISISGNMETGQQFQDVFSQLDLDWEELIAQLSNDTLARMFGNFLRRFVDWGEESIILSQENIADYLKEELQILPTEEMVDKVREKTESLRQDVDRLQQRIEKLQQKVVRGR